MPTGSRSPGSIARLTRTRIAAALSGQADEWRDDGIAAVRFGSRTTDHPVYTTTRPHFMLLLEWQRRPPPAAS